MKRWMMTHAFQPGAKLPKEGELQKIFHVSKPTIREALKSLEVQGFITISAGAHGGATLREVPLIRTVQLLQNYLYFQDVDYTHLYAVRRIVEPELAAGAVPHLTADDIQALERSISICEPISNVRNEAIIQRQEDLHFHDVFANANPNPFLRFIANMINAMLRELVVFGNPSHEKFQAFGSANVTWHKDILEAAKRGDADTVRRLMAEHIDEAERHMHNLEGLIQKRLLLDSDIRMGVVPPRPADQDGRDE
jgi:DNA-binding FadR family transcriptional regulator